MKYYELFEVDFKKNLVNEFNGIDLHKCSVEELSILKKHLSMIKEHADVLTLEEEIVGYVYNNLSVLLPKIKFEESKKLVKVPITKAS